LDCVFLFLLLLALVCRAAPLGAAELHPGDLLVITDGENVVRVDPATGDQTIISSKSVGSGPTITMSALVVNSIGELFALGDSGGTADGATILRIDPATGNRTVFSNNAHGSGPTTKVFGQFGTASLLSDGSIFTSSWTEDYFIRVDTTTGNRTAVPSTMDVHPSVPLSFTQSAGLVGDVYLSDYLNGLILRQDAFTGARSILSSTVDQPASGWFPVGTGYEPVGFAGGVAFDPESGFTYALSGGALYRVDPNTGNRTAVSVWSASDPGDLIGTGPSVYFSGGLVREASGTFVVAVHKDHLIRIDPVTGDRAYVTSFSELVGPLEGLAVVPHPVPEPSTLALAGVGVLGCIAGGWRKRRGRTSRRQLS